MDLFIAPDGTVRCVYAETIDLCSLGVPTITRASHVEPDRDGTWWADLSPLHGPTLGPFLARTTALAAEHHWLRTHWPTAC